MSTPKASKQGAPHRRPGKKTSDKSTKALHPSDLIDRMEACPTAEKLNADVIAPFIQALVTVCDARGYVLNIYGEHCNLAITPENHAEELFELIESYLDQSGLG